MLSCRMHIALARKHANMRTTWALHTRPHDIHLRSTQQGGTTHTPTRNACPHPPLSIQSLVLQSARLSSNGLRLPIRPTSGRLDDEYSLFKEAGFRVREQAMHKEDLDLNYKDDHLGALFTNLGLDNTPPANLQEDWFERPLVKAVLEPVETQGAGGAYTLVHSRVGDQDGPGLS